jgi:hypothetical protein
LVPFCRRGGGPSFRRHYSLVLSQGAAANAGKSWLRRGLPVTKGRPVSFHFVRHAGPALRPEPSGTVPISKQRSGSPASGHSPSAYGCFKFPKNGAVSSYWATGATSRRTAGKYSRVSVQVCIPDAEPWRKGQLLATAAARAACGTTSNKASNKGDGDHLSGCSAALPDDDCFLSRPRCRKASGNDPRPLYFIPFISSRRAEGRSEPRHFGRKCPQLGVWKAEDAAEPATPST